MRTLTSDLRFATRTLFKTPGFALVAILSLALGIGANTAIFSLIDSVLLRMLPVSHPEELHFVNTNAVQMGDMRLSMSVTRGVLEAMQKRAKTVVGLCSSDSNAKLNIGVDGTADLASGVFATGNYFSQLGVPALIGRTFAESDDTADGRVAVISFGYWQKRFGGDPAVVGRAITVNRVPFTIVGVAPREFYGTSMDKPMDIALPFATQIEVKEAQISSTEPKPTDAAGEVFVRVKAGTEKAAATELTAIFRQEAAAQATSDPQEVEQVRKSWIELAPAGQGFSSARSRFSEPLKILMVVVGFVMLIACANIANLLLAKASARTREIAIRLSLGSTRGRLVRQLLTESLLLSVLGGALGLLFAVWARQGIILLGMRSDRPTIIPDSWNWRVLGFTAAVCVLNAVLFGIAPALRATGVDLAAALKSGRTGRTAGRLPLAKILVAAQVSLSLALLVGAGLFLETFRNLDRVNLGVDRDRALMVTIDPSLAGYKEPARSEIYRQVMEKVAALPGVRSTAWMQTRMLSGNVMLNSVSVPGYTPRKGESAMMMFVISNEVGPGFFAKSGMKLAAGRDFTEQDNAGAPGVVAINENMAKHFFSGRNAIGEKILLDPKEPPLTVVAIVKDFKIFGLQERRQDAMFRPFLQQKEHGAATLLVRTAGDPLNAAADVRAAIRGVDAKIPQFDMITMDRQVANLLTQERLLATLAIAFGALALCLAAIGLYGVLSYGVAQRTGEIGIRMALGAERGRILRQILGETARLVALGMALGIGIAYVGAREAQKMLYGVKPADAWSIGIALGILAGAALIAGFLPARRAARVDPMVALRHE